MTQTTFGYDGEQDRLWLKYDPNQPRIWLTRRLTQGIAGPVTQLVERTTPGIPAQGNNASQRVHMEHQIATTETPQGKPHYPFHLNVESREQLHEQGFVLCKVLKTHIEAHGAVIEMLCDEQHQVRFNLSRQDLHLWLRALKMALEKADWNLSPPLPEWLQRPLLPDAIDSLLKAAIPLDIQNEPPPDQPGPNAPH